MELNKLSEEIFNSTYRFNGETIEGMWTRVAEKLSESETDSDKWKKDFYETLEDFKFIPGGRILSNAGTPYKGTSYINCFVSGFRGEDQDSMESIFNELRRQGLILKSEGGYGFCASVLRPRGTMIKGIGIGTPGMVKFLEMWDKQSQVITEGSGVKNIEGKEKSRKGAQMITGFIWHPDIEEFITAKQTEGRLTKCNMSVLLTDKFMEAVIADGNWELIFPDIEADKPLYKKSWDGDIEVWKSLGGQIKVYKTLRAVELYDLIMKSTYNRNEPGCIFIDTVNRMNNLKHIETISACNPCGEQYLPKNGSCLLGSINATQFINEDRTDWDYDKLEKYIPSIVRMLDNVNDITYLPLPEQYEEVKNKRRIGIGVTGLGSALMMMKVEYGGQESLKLVTDYFEFVTNKIYQASALLAKEKGPFPLWNHENFIDSNFWKEVLTDETIGLIEKYGLRNSHLTSVQPTGNTGVLANNISGGLEPVFMHEYIRTHGVDFLPKEIPPYTEWGITKTEGDVTFKTYWFDGVLYKWNQSGGYVKESLVEDYAVRYLKSLGEWDSKASWAKTTELLNVDSHLNIMEIIARSVDSAISKTVNIPNNYPFEDFKNLYIKVWKTGTIKGITSYRAGTMSAVLKKVEEVITITTKRPKILPCDIHHLKASGDDWLVLVGLFKGKPYEIFAFKEMEISLSKNVKKGNLVKLGKGYNLETDAVTIKNIANYFGSDEEQALTRMISTLGLRQGIDLNYIIDQLSQVPTSVTAFCKAITRTLAKYAIEAVLEEKCSQCGGKLTFSEGCKHCTSCNWQGCT